MFGYGIYERRKNVRLLSIHLNEKHGKCRVFIRSLRSLDGRAAAVWADEARAADRDGSLRTYSSTARKSATDF